MIAALIRWSMVNRFLVLVAYGDPGRRQASGPCSERRSMRCRISRIRRSSSAHLSRASAAGRRGPGHLSARDDDDAVPGAKTVRGYSFFGDSFVYVLFEDETDLYWARSRVLEY